MLHVGTILRGIYRIDSYLSSGGFGNTYVATNIEFDERVAIKEFFMKGVTQRDDNQTTVSVSNTENSNSFLEQREKFKKEARRIRQLNNPHIVRVHDLFEENGTAYYVMDYVDGENLAERLKRIGKPMTEGEVNQILPQILDALKSIHNAGIWHLDLKPANIMVDKSGNVRLIDFGASKQLNAQKGGATTSTAISYTNGYAPREQMEQNYDKFGPWTDIYALGATIYNLLTNKRPPLPTDIDDDVSKDKRFSLSFPEITSEGMKNFVLLLMQTNRRQRPQNIDELYPKMELLESSSVIEQQKSDFSTPSEHFENEETILSDIKSQKKTIDRDNNSQIATKELDDQTSRTKSATEGESTIKTVKHNYQRNLIGFILITILISCGINTIIPGFYAVFGDYSTLYESYQIENVSLEQLVPIIDASIWITNIGLLLLSIMLIIRIWNANRVLSLVLLSLLLIIFVKDIYDYPTIYFILHDLTILFIIYGLILNYYYDGKVKVFGKYFAVYGIFCVIFFVIFEKIEIDSNLSNSSYLIYGIIFWGILIIWLYGIWQILKRHSEMKDVCNSRKLNLALIIPSVFFLLFPIIDVCERFLTTTQSTEDVSNNTVSTVSNELRMSKADSSEVAKVNANQFAKTITAIDLGLPSGTKWADRNVGAKSPMEYGNLYRYGNPNTKLNGSNNKFSKENNIIGTKNDVAMVKLGNNWRTPSISQIEELVKYCKSALITVNNKKVVVVIGPNGNHLFFPLVGCMFNYGRSQDQMWGLYEAGNLTSSAYSLQLVVDDEGKVDIMDTQEPGYYGCAIRAVTAN